MKVHVGKSRETVSWSRTQTSSTLRDSEKCRKYGRPRHFTARELYISNTAIWSSKNSFQTAIINHERSHTTNRLPGEQLSPEIVFTDDSSNIRLRWSSFHGEIHLLVKCRPNCQAESYIYIYLLSSRIKLPMPFKICLRIMTNLY